MHINYDYYRIFYCVATLKSFTGAAKALMNNQPNITRSIKNLEAALGCTLFLRSNRGVSLTPEGEKLYSHIQIAYEHIQMAEEELSLDKALQSGTVSIGTSETALYCLLLPILKKFRLLYPGVNIHVTNHSTPQAISALKNGFVDFAVVTTPTVKSNSLIEKKLAAVREIAICGRGYPEIVGKKLSLTELANYPIISLGAGTKTFELYSNFFIEKNIAFKPDIEVATADQILPLVKSNLGIGFLAEQFLDNNDGIYIINLEEELPIRHICLIKRKKHSLSIAAKKLEQMIIAHKT